jgi:hypothetical protein
MEKRLKPSDVKKFISICKEINGNLSLDNPIMENEKKDLARQTKRFKKLLEYTIPEDEKREE